MTPAARQEPQSLAKQAPSARTQGRPDRNAERAFVSILPGNESLVAAECVTSRDLSSESPGFGGTRSVRAFLSPEILSLLPVIFAIALGVLLVVISLALSVRELPAAIALPRDAGAGSDLLLSFISPELADTIEVEAASEAVNVPRTPVTLQVATHTVKRGDNLGAIATRFGVTLDSIISMNGIKTASRVAAGTVLKIPNMSGIVHTVTRGENLSIIAGRYKVAVTTILDANDLASETIAIGTTLFIPGARLSANEMKKALGKLVIWPVRGRLSSYFGYRTNPFTGSRQFHNGLDIISDYGNTVKAAMDGKVADTGYNTVYGNYIILSHSDGYQTMYGHLSRVSVRKGGSVSQGGGIGTVGNSGISTGSHLHFSLFKGGSAINPLKMLN